MAGIPIIKINGVTLPAPDIGLQIQRQQLVDSARNALGEVVAQTVNHRLVKLNQLKWSYLSREDWGKIVREINKFEGSLTYFDAADGWKTIKVYWGDATEEPFLVNDNGETLTYKNCTCNVIDMGY